MRLNMTYTDPDTLDYGACYASEGDTRRECCDDMIAFIRREYGELSYVLQALEALLGGEDSIEFSERDSGAEWSFSFE